MTDEIKERLKCSGKCKKEKDRKSGFYNTNNKLYANTGKIPVCKQCLRSTVNYDDMESIYSILRQFDIMFDVSYWEKAEESKLDTFARYMTMANSLPQFEGFTWKDSVFEHVEVKDDAKSTEKHELPTTTEMEITDELLDKWGYGYTNDEYKQFERKYKKLINNYGEKTALHTEGLVNYIRYRVKEEISTAKGEVKEAKEWGQLASKAAQDAKINVSQLSKSDISGGVDVLSQMFEAVETEVSVIPLLPRLLEQPYDDADLIIWATVNYNRRLEDKAAVPYRDVWNFYDEMLQEHFEAQGYDGNQIKGFKEKRNNVFRDLEKVYKEPLYEGDGE